MTILKLTGFSCEAEVLGVPRKVTFTGSTLCVAGLDLGDAYRVLEAVSVGSVIGVTPPVGNFKGAECKQTVEPAFLIGNPIPQLSVEAPKVEDSKIDPGQAIACKGVVGGQPSQENVNVVNPASQSAPPEAVEGGASHLGKADKKKREHKPYVKAANTVEPASLEDGDLECGQEEEPEPLVLSPVKSPSKEERAVAMQADMKAATKLRDIVLLLQENGVTVIEDMVAECERVKADIPLLKAIPNLSDRIGRTIQYLGDA
jgi:hypothetical protein